MWNFLCRASNTDSHFSFSLLSFIRTLQKRFPWKCFSVITCRYLSIYQKPHTMIIKSSSPQGHHLVPLQRLCITMICWHMLKQLGDYWKKTTAWKASVYFVVPPSLSTLSIALQAGKSSSQGWQYSINTLFVLISGEKHKKVARAPSAGGNILEFTGSLTRT